MLKKLIYCEFYQILPSNVWRDVSVASRISSYLASYQASSLFVFASVLFATSVYSRVLSSVVVCLCTHSSVVVIFQRLAR